MNEPLVVRNARLLCRYSSTIPRLSGFDVQDVYIEEKSYYTVIELTLVSSFVSELLSDLSRLVIENFRIRDGSHVVFDSKQFRIFDFIYLGTTQSARYTGADFRILVYPKGGPIPFIEGYGIPEVISTFPKSTMQDSNLYEIMDRNLNI